MLPTFLPENFLHILGTSRHLIRSTCRKVVKDLAMDGEDYLAKFRGPTFNALIEFAAMKKHSLIREVEVRSPTELSAIVVGVSVYEVLREMPECNILIHAMERVKRKQSRLEKNKIFLWMDENLPSKGVPPLMNQHYMRKADMRLFLARCPMSVLPNSVFKPFIPIVKNFLLAHLYKFRRNRMLYRSPPDFPPEDQLPRVINAFGTVEYLENNYPHLAPLRSDVYGFVTYSYPAFEMLDDGGNPWSHEGAHFLRSGPEFPRKRRAELERFDYNDNYRHKRAVKERATADPQNVNTEELETAGPSTSKSSTPTNQLASLIEAEQQSASSLVGEISPCGDDALLKGSAVQDDWTDMLDMVLTDPDLPSQYKTMIQRLVATNRDLKNAISQMKSEA
ncbi:hypothetical protein Angca_000051 [Angiostrongylus cantonensis]|nr:hypothetical protein Angca_000051 [Angiostrongylus cantonensis]